MARVALESVSKVFGSLGKRVAAVRDITLQVEENEYLVLVGPSGCGKTTTLRMIAGLERPTSGNISIAGREMAGVSPRRRNVALVFQNQPLFPHLNVARNLSFGIKERTQGDWPASIGNWFTSRNRSAESAACKVETHVLIREAARELGVEHLLDRMPRQLSGGERQRVALGRAAVRNPAVFLLDEPLANLDGNLRTELRDLLRRMHARSNAATLHVTHDQGEALALADRLAVLEGGVLRQIGPPLELYDRPQDTWVASFLGDPPMNLLVGSREEAEGRARWICSPCRAEIEILSVGPQGSRGKVNEQEELSTENRPDLLLGVRAEHIRLGAPRERKAANWRVRRVECLGSETRVWLEPHENERPGSAPQERLIAKLDTRTALQPGEPVSASVDAAKAHWFDRQTGKRLI